MSERGSISLPLCSVSLSRSLLFRFTLGIFLDVRIQRLMYKIPCRSELIYIELHSLVLQLDDMTNTLPIIHTYLYRSLSICFLFIYTHDYIQIYIVYSIYNLHLFTLLLFATLSRRIQLNLVLQFYFFFQFWMILSLVRESVCECVCPVAARWRLLSSLALLLLLLLVIHLNCD